MTGFRSSFRRDLERFVQPSQAPRGVRMWLKILAEPGLQFVLLARIQMAAERRKRIGLARLVHLVNLRFTGGEFGHGCSVGPGLVTKHPLGVLVGGGTTLGADCTVLHNVTFGELRLEEVGPRKYPQIGDRVMIGNGAAVLGGVQVGDGAQIGAGAVVIHDLEAGETAVGVPARPIRKRKER